MSLNTISLQEFVDNVADRIWEKEKKDVVPAARNSGIFMVDSWGEGTGDSRTYNEVDLERYAGEIDEGDDAETAKVQIGYEKVVKPFAFGKDISITWQMRRRNKYTDVKNRLTNLAQLVSNRVELDLQHRFTFGTATSYVTLDGKTRDITTGDGLSLFSTAHTLTGSATTYRNRIAGNPQISKGALEAMEKLIVEQTFNNFGTKMDMSYDILWTTDDPNSVNTTRELLQSTAETSAPNNGVVNVYKSKYKHIRLPLVATTANGAPDATKAKYWGLVSSMNSSSHLSIEEEPNVIPPSSSQDGESNNSSRDWVFKGRGSYAIVIVSGRGHKFSSGDGAA